MWTKLKEGDSYNRLDCEFYCDTDAEIATIPSDDIRPFSKAIAINSGNLHIWICDSQKNWYQC